MGNTVLTMDDADCKATITKAFYLQIECTYIYLNSLHIIKYIALIITTISKALLLMF